MKNRKKFYASFTDAQLITQFQNGNNEAFDALVNRYSGFLNIFINSIIRNTEYTKDIAQDTWEEVLKLLRLHEYKEEEYFKSWLQSIARHITLKVIFTGKKYVHNQVYLDALVSVIHSDGLSVRQKKLLHRALSHLSRRMHKIIYMHYYLKMTFLEIAGSLKVSLGYITSEKSKAIKKLRAELVSPAL